MRLIKEQMPARWQAKWIDPELMRPWIETASAYAVHRDATTIWERWKGIDETGRPSDSLNHYAYGAVAGWLMDSVCGIRVAYGNITISPHPDRRLSWARAAYRSPLGQIRSSWRYDAERLILEGEIPPDRTAALIVPGQQPVMLKGGEYQFIL